MGRGLHPERWGRVAFVWPEKPFRAVGDGCPGGLGPRHPVGDVGGKGVNVVFCLLTNITTFSRVIHIFLIRPLRIRRAFGEAEGATANG